MDDLTPRQQAYFKLLESMEPSEDLQRSIRAAKEDLKNDRLGDRVVRGLTRVKGFTANPDDKSA
jgi:hypothetical protein